MVAVVAVSLNPLYPFFTETFEENEMATAPNLSSLNVTYRPQPTAHQHTAMHPLLELSLAQTNSQGAYLRSGRPATRRLEWPSRL